MSGFVLHPGALADLHEIWKFIAADNSRATGGFWTNRAVLAFPQLGHIRADLTSRPLRFQAVRDFLIVCARDEKPPLVLAVLHGRRNPRVIVAFLRNGR
jgi:plasmid stabilization system protein ParE